MPKTLGELLAAAVLEPPSAAAATLAWILDLQSKLEVQFLDPALYAAHPERLDPRIAEASAFLQSVVALRELLAGKKPGEIRLLNIPLPSFAPVATPAPSPVRVPAKRYPGETYGLTPVEAARTLDTIFYGDSPLEARLRTVLRRNGVKMFGELVEGCQGKPRGALRYSGVGAKMIDLIAAAFITFPAITAATGDNVKLAPAETESTEPWAELGLTEAAWKMPLKKMFPAKMGPRTNKARRVIGKRRVTIGELCTATQLKPARIGKYFGRGCGPSTRKFIQQTVLALAAPVEPPAPA